MRQDSLLSLGLVVWLIAACVPVAAPSPAWLGTSAGSQTQGHETFPDDIPEVDTFGEPGYIPGPGDQNGTDGGYIHPHSLLFCGESGTVVLQRGQSTQLQWGYPDGVSPQAPLDFTLEATPSDIADVGSIVTQSALTARYYAPAQIPQEFTVDVRAHLGDQTTPAVCRVRLVVDGGLGVLDDGVTQGTVGNVYVLEPNTQRLPDFSLMDPISEIVMPGFDVPARSFSLGFPGVADLFEWFGIRFEGRLKVSESGLYRFRLNSDDGSILWINGEKVVDNDGVHAPRTVEGSIRLEPGAHPFRLDYFQGPRYYIALQLFWRGPGASAFEIVPPDNILRPATHP